MSSFGEKASSATNEACNGTEEQDEPDSSVSENDIQQQDNLLNGSFETVDLSQDQTQSTVSVDLSPIKRFHDIQDIEDSFEFRKGSARNVKALCRVCNKSFFCNGYKRIAIHIKNCRQFPKDTGSTLTLRINEKLDSGRRKISKLDRLLTLALIENNWPLRSISSKSFKEFMSTAAPTYHLPERRRISTEIIPNLSSELESSFYKFIDAARDYELSIEFDHWTDLSYKSILGVVATKANGDRFLIELEEVSLVGHSAKSIVKSLATILQKIDPKKINAITSDSASNCKKSKTEFIALDGYRHVIEHRCLAHLLNNIGKHMCKADPFNYVVSITSSLANHLSKDTQFLAIQQIEGFKRIKPIAPTRWYSTVHMLSSLLESRKEALRYLESVTKADRGKQFEMVGILKDVSLWEGVETTLSFLRPISECIALAERASGSVGETMNQLLCWMKSIFTASWDNQYTITAATSILTFINVDKLGRDEFGLMLAAYYLDRRFKMNYITREGRIFIGKAILKIASKCGCSKDEISLQLPSELDSYRDQAPTFRLPVKSGQPAYDWWSNLANQRSCLKLCALRLATLKSSSANMERIFSVLKFVQGNNRARYHNSTLTSIARVKMSMTETNSKIDNEFQDAIEEIHDKTNIEADSNVQSICCVEPTQVETTEATTNGDKVMKLKEELRKSYKFLFSLIDFDIVNEQILTIEEIEETLLTEDDFDRIASQLS